MRVPKDAICGLGPVPLTMLAPLWARACESRRPSPILTDWSSVTTAAAVDFEFTRLRLHRAMMTGACVRTALMDSMVRSSLQADPRLMLVNLGEGLDDRFGRVDNGVMSCMDLDLPEVIRIRSGLLPETPRRRPIAKSALDVSWMDEVGPGFRTVLLVAEGVLMYLPAKDVRSLFARAAERFPGVEIVFDTVSPGIARFGAPFELGRGMSARYQWGVKHAGEMEEWGIGYKLLERRSIFEAHRDHFGFLVRAITRLSSSFAWTHSVNRFRLGEQS